MHLWSWREPPCQKKSTWSVDPLSHGAAVSLHLSLCAMLLVSESMSINCEEQHPAMNCDGWQTVIRHAVRKRCATSGASAAG